MDKIKFILVVLFFSCNDIEYKYKVVGKVNTEKGKRDAIWYSDTIWFDRDTAYYINSDSSIVKIYPPYEIIKIK